MTKNPYSGQHDGLYQNWKNIATISQAMGTIEAELKAVYSLAEASHASTRAVFALPAPVAKAPLEVLSAMDVTDEVAKRTPRNLKGANKQLKESAKGATMRTKRTGGQDNTVKVLAQLQTVLNDHTFTNLNQSSIAAAIGLPKGSIGASIKKLIQDGKLVQGHGKDFKLATAA